MHAPPPPPPPVYSSATSVSSSTATILKSNSENGNSAAPAPAPSPAVSAHGKTPQNNPIPPASVTLPTSNSGSYFAGPLVNQEDSVPALPARLPAPTDSLDDKDLFSPCYPSLMTPLDTDLTNTELSEIVSDLMEDFGDDKQRPNNTKPICKVVSL